MKSIFSRTLFTLITMVSFSHLARADDDDDDLAVNEVEGSLSVMVLGSGGPIATAEGRASAGYLIFTDGKPRILMDVGGGTFQRLAESGTNIKDLDIILLSHLHADHTGDLTPVIKTAYFHNNLARTQARMKAKAMGIPWDGFPRPRVDPFRIYGPAVSTLPHDGTGKVTYPDGTTVYPSTASYVDGHYSVPAGGVERYLKAFVGGISGGASVFDYDAFDLPLKMPVTPAPPIYMSVKTIFDEDGLVVKYIPVDHGPVPAVAFRIEYKGHSIVYSGDTGSKGLGGGPTIVNETIVPGMFGAGNMTAISQDADLLIYDTAVMEADGLPDNPLFHILHTQPSLIGNVARDANVKKLLLSHITPVTGPRLDEVKNLIRDQGFSGKIKTAKDLKVFNLGDDD
jgi:ribonuclease BN (tRNA processing enzyme)